jgi:choline kinase
MKAILLAAGTGTRLGSITRDFPKFILDIHGRSLLERSLDNLQRNGIEEAIITVGFQKQKIIDELGYKFKDMPIKYAVNDHYDTASTAISFYQSRNLISDESLLVYADLLYEPDAIKFLLEDRSRNCMLVVPISGLQNPAYVKIDQFGCLENLVKGEKHKPHVYGETGDIFKLSKNFLQGLYAMIEEEWDYGIKDRFIERAILDLSKREPVNTVKKDLLWIGINTEDALERARNEIYPQIKKKLNSQGIDYY